MTGLFNLPRRRLVVVALAGAVLIILLLWLFQRGSESSELPTFPVKRGDFIVSITESGELRAKNSVGVSAPRVRGNLQIIFLAPKGTTVAAGDTLVVFDGTEVQERIDEKQNELEISQANLAKSRSNMANTMADLEAQLESARASYRIAELRLEQMQFEADVVKEEQQLSLQQSRISLEQAEKNIEQQQIINEAELTTLELKVDQARNDLRQAKRDLEKLTVTAPQPGLVVYQKIWKGGSEPQEVKVGDTPWRGQGLIELPDLSIMVVETSVNEVDVAQMKDSLRATIIPDAFPDRRYLGTVYDVARLARIDERSDAEVKVFDVLVQLDEADDVLKPGMTVSTTILVEEVPDTLYIPLDAVFSHEGGTVVYRRAGSGFRRTPVELGIRNDNYIIVQDGLEVGQSVALVDPNKPFDPETWTGGSVQDEETLPNRATGTNGGAGR